MELDLQKFIRRKTDTGTHKAEDILQGLSGAGIGEVSLGELHAASGASERVIRGIIGRSNNTITIDELGLLHLSVNRLTIAHRSGHMKEPGSGFRGAKRPYRGK